MVVISYHLPQKGGIFAVGSRIFVPPTAVPGHIVQSQVSKSRPGVGRLRWGKNPYDRLLDRGHVRSQLRRGVSCPNVREVPATKGNGLGIDGAAGATVVSSSGRS